jgi:YesN/AraC family two-component response regulator
MNYPEIILNLSLTYLSACLANELSVSFQGLINEQLVNKDQLYLLSFGSQIEPVWEAIHDVNCRM